MVRNDKYGPASSVRWLLLMVTDQMILLYVPLVLCILKQPTKTEWKNLGNKYSESIYSFATIMVVIFF